MHESRSDGEVRPDPRRSRAEIEERAHDRAILAGLKWLVVIEASAAGRVQSVESQPVSIPEVIGLNAEVVVPMEAYEDIGCRAIVGLIGGGGRIRTQQTARIRREGRNTAGQAHIRARLSGAERQKQASNDQDRAWKGARARHGEVLRCGDRVGGFNRLTAGVARGLLAAGPTYLREEVMAARARHTCSEGIPDADGCVETKSGCELSGSSSSTRAGEQAGAEDLALVAAVLRKDRKATAEFVNTYTDAVYTFVRRRLAPRVDLVDDLVQEVFIAAWENLMGFRGTSPLRAWLIGIARHKVEDYYRGLLQSAQVLAPGAAEETSASDFDLDAIVEQARNERQARRILEELPEHYSAALKWRYWEKCSARQMAEATGRSERAIERLLARAREQFRRRWLV